MSRAAARRTWEAARDRGARPLSWRMYVSLLDAAGAHGTHCANNGDAAYSLQRRGLVSIDYPWARVTDLGRSMLAEIARAAQ